jgi:hypothetical protein
MCPFLNAKKITAAKSKIEKIKIKDFFLPHWLFFYVNKKEAPYAFWYTKTNLQTQNRKFSLLRAQICSLLKVDLPRAPF